MSVGLFINTLKSWFWGMAGTFAPAGVGGSPSNSIFYEDPTFIKIASAHGSVEIIWYVGSRQASVYYDGEVTDIIALNFGVSLITTNGRINVYQILKDIADGIETATGYISPDIFNYINKLYTVNPGSGTSGTYSPYTKTVSLADVSDLGHFASDWVMNIHFTSLVIHEFQHAYDFGTGIFEPGETGDIVEQSATTKTMTFLKDIYESQLATFVALPEGSPQIPTIQEHLDGIRNAYQSELDYYKENGGSDSQWDDIMKP